MQSTARILLRLWAAALVVSPWAARAQSMYYTPPPSGPQFYLGGSIGASVFSDQRGQLSGGLDAINSATAALGAGDAYYTYVHQEQSDFGAKVYGGAWITPNVGVEAGYTYLGRIRWSAFTTDLNGYAAVAGQGEVQPHAWYEAVLLGVKNYGVRYFVKGGAYEAATDQQAGSFSLNTGAAYGPSTTSHNAGGLAGVGLSSTYGHFAYRLEVEDYIDVGPGSLPPSGQIPAWRGSVVLVSAGVAYMF
jgi:hypothetical protein